MKTQKLLIVLASAGLALGLAGCNSTDKKAEDTPKPPSISQVEKQKQKAEKEAKAKAEAEAKAKAEQEAKAKAEAEAKAKTEAEAAAKAKAPAPAPAKAQPKARTYQRKAQPKRHYQAPRRSGTKAAPKPKGNSGSKGGWSNGSTNTKDGKSWYVKDDSDSATLCFDSEGNSWPC